MKIVNTDNFIEEYPNESFLNLPPLSDEAIITIAKLINEECSGPKAPRYWLVVSDAYKLTTTMEDKLRNK